MTNRDNIKDDETDIDPNEINDNLDKDIKLDNLWDWFESMFIEKFGGRI